MTTNYFIPIGRTAFPTLTVLSLTTNRVLVKPSTVDPLLTWLLDGPIRAGTVRDVLTKGAQAVLMVHPDLPSDESITALGYSANEVDRWIKDWIVQWGAHIALKDALRGSIS